MPILMPSARAAGALSADAAVNTATATVIFQMFCIA
jgi:hypothetical protein